MPPRYAYWTIIVDNQPTAFRAGALDDIMPTFNRLKEKQPTAKLMWFQSGKLWPSRIDAREAMQVRGERGRYSDPRQDGGDKSRSPERPKWRSKDFSAKPRASAPERTQRPEWTPKGSPSPSTRPFTGRRSEGDERPEWKPKTSGEKPEWKPRGASSERPAWKPKGAGDRPAWKGRDDSRSSGKPEWKPRGTSSPKPQPGPQRGTRAGVEASSRERSERPEWKPKGTAADVGAEKRKWIPKAEYKKLTGTEAKRDDKWRPGGEHKDPRQKYKDAKKAKWGRFKQAIRSRAAKTKKS
jgi:hypothetical protein